MAIALVHSSSSTSGSNYVLSTTITASAPVAAGNYLLLFVVDSSSADNVSGVSDNLGNTWTKLAAGVSNGNLTGAFWYCQSAKAGTPIITVTGPSYVVWNLILREYSGVSSNTPLEVISTNIESAFVSTHTVTTASAVTANDLVIGAYIATQTTDTFTPTDSSGNQVTTTGSPFLCATLSDRTVSTAGTKSISFTSGNTDQGIAFVLAFKASTGITIPVAPTNLLTIPGNAQIELDWDDVAGAASYNVYRSTVSGTRGSLINGAPVTPPASGPTNLNNFPLIFNDQFATNCSEGSFLSAYPKWGAYDDGTNDTAANNNGTNSGYNNSILSVANGILSMRCHVDNASGRAWGAVPYPILDPALAGYNFGDCTLKYGRVQSVLRCLSPKVGWKTAWLWWAKSYDIKTTQQGITPATWPSKGETDFPEGSLNGGMSANMHWYGGTSGSSQDSFNPNPQLRYDQGWVTVTQEWTPSTWKFWIQYGDHLDTAGATLIGTSTGAHVSPDPMRFCLQTETEITANQSQRPIANQNNIIEINRVSVWKYQNGYVAA